MSNHPEDPTIYVDKTTPEAHKRTPPPGIQGWGADLDPAMRPAYPMERTPTRFIDPPQRMERQRDRRPVKVFHSTERPGLTHRRLAVNGGGALDLDVGDGGGGRVGGGEDQRGGADAGAERIRAASGYGRADGHGSGQSGRNHEQAAGGQAPTPQPVTGLFP